MPDQDILVGDLLDQIERHRSARSNDIGWSR